MQDLVGKTIKEIKTNTYHTSINIEFDDGTQLKLSPGSTGCHNDRWMTIEHEILKKDFEPLK